MSGVVGDEAKSYVEKARTQLKAAGLENIITPVEAASIIAYSEHHYAALNAALREGSVSQKELRFADGVNAALEKLPPYRGITERGVYMGPEVAARYQLGAVIEEHQFLSTGKGFSFDGNMRFYIDGKYGRDISKLASHGEKEMEVLFRSGSRFLVTRREGNTVWMKEIDQ